MSTNELIQRRAAMMQSRSGSVDWETIARGMVDFTTEFSMPIIAGVDFNNKASVFAARSNLKSCDIPPTMTIIGTSCFSNCTGLKQIVIPEGITQINSGAFSYCHHLTSVTLPSTLTTIGTRAFISCQMLDHITIPSSVTTMDADCLSYTYNMVYVIMEGSTPPALGTGAFTQARSLAAIYVPDASVSAYQSATNWTTYASKIKGISERPT